MTLHDFLIASECLQKEAASTLAGTSSSKFYRSAQGSVNTSPAVASLPSISPNADGRNGILSPPTPKSGDKAKITSELFKKPKNNPRSADVPKPQPGVGKMGADHTVPLMAAAGLGGGAGYLAGKALLAPGLEDLARRATMGAKAAPIGGAVVGALVLAALVALYRNRDRGTQYPTGAGFKPQDQVRMY